MHPLIERALRYWLRDRTIPLDLFVQLQDLGFDVEHLETHYRSLASKAE